MRVQYRNNSLPIRGAVLIQDVRDYYAKLLIQTPIQVPNYEIIEVELDSRIEHFVVKKQEFIESGFHTTLVTEKQDDTLSKIYESVQGVMTVEEVANTIGMKVAPSVKTNKTWWSIPRSSCRTILDTLSRYASVPDGGAPVFFINLKGELDMIDYVWSTTKQPITAQGGVKTDVIDVEWMYSYPANLQIYGFSVDGPFEEEVCMTKNLPWARRFVSDNTGNFKNLVIQAFKNKYNRLLYTSEVIEFESAVPLLLGDYISLGEDLELNYVVESVKTPLFTTNQQIVKFKIRAVCRPSELK